MSRTGRVGLPTSLTLSLMGIILFATMSVACGGGSGSSGGGGSPTNPISGLTFTASGTATGNTIELRAVSVTATELVLEVHAVGVNDLYAVAFDLAFPDNALSFQSATEGPFLASNNTATDLVVADTGGRLVVGHTRLGIVNGRNGSGALMTLRFSAAGTGSGSLSFEQDSGFGSDGFRLNLRFFGGSVTVTL